VTVLAWRALALLSLAIGAVGVLLPGLPTVPFILLAGWSSGRGWPELERRILAHERYGPALRNWREYGTVPRRAKVLASLMLSLSVAAFWLSGLPATPKLLLTLLLLAVGGWLWSRPECPAGASDRS